MDTKKSYSISQFLFDIWCVVSIIGIWPRFIEPNLLSTTRLNLHTKNLDSFKIVQFSDLHFNEKTSDLFLDRLSARILKESPDMILFTGDFICHSKMECADKLKNFLNRFSAPYGCFAVLGNHDYDRFVSINDKGEYDIIEKSSSTFGRGLKRLFSNITLKKRATAAAKEAKLHEELIALLKETPFKLLHNNYDSIQKGKAKINLVGLGEYCLGQCHPEKAFQSLDLSNFTLVLSHNPDSFSVLKDYPGHLILSGHTHGGQVNLPWFRKKFALAEDDRLIRGLVTEKDKKPTLVMRRMVGVISAVKVQPSLRTELPEINRAAKVAKIPIQILISPM
jgi:predicted MPP superfamily phosphohydrolase